MKMHAILLLASALTVVMLTSCGNQSKDKFKKDSETQVAQINYEAIGLNIANETKVELSKNLMVAIKNYGTIGAIEFCNIKAIPITDSMANQYNAFIKRVSDQPRNVDNRANESELTYISEMKVKMVKGEVLSPKVYELEGKMIGYYPIETNGMCLQCHGKPNQDILPKTLSKIKELYPNDKAIDYTENQLRGIWVVTMDKK